MGVSVIIPAWNEESCLGETLRRLRQQQPEQIIVVDGGSTDATCRIAAADLLLHGSRGRADQMNLGAAHAQGDVRGAPVELGQGRLIEQPAQKTAEAGKADLE